MSPLDFTGELGNNKAKVRDYLNYILLLDVCTVIVSLYLISNLNIFFYRSVWFKIIKHSRYMPT